MSGASPEAREAHTNVQLLAQRLEALEKRDALQDGEIKTLKSSSDMLKGEMQGAKEQVTRSENSNSKIIGWAIPIVVLVAGGFISNNVTSENKALRIEVAKLTTEAAAANERLKVVEARRPPDPSAELAKFDTRITTVESVQTTMQQNSQRRDAELGQIRTALSANDAKTSSIEQNVLGNLNSIQELKQQVTINLRNIAALDSKSSAGFVEVESQLRGIVAMMSVKLDDVDGKLGTMWHKIIGQPLPETKPLPNNIPAQATTTIGGGSTQ